MNNEYKDTIKVGVPFKGMIAHRGVSGIETENTLKSFLNAAKRSYLGIECDIHSSKDGYLLISHDASLKRVTGEDLVISEHDFSELRKVAFPDKASLGEKNKEINIPLLKEYLKLCKDYNKIPVVELKETLSADDIDNFIKEIKEFELEERVVVISFFAGYLTKIREVLPKTEIQFLCDSFNDTIFDMCVHFNFGLDILYTKMTEEIIKRYHEKGLKVNVWTCDDKETAQRLISYGIDYITSNILE